MAAGRSIQSPKSHFARFKNRYSCVCHGCHVDVALSLSLCFNSPGWGWDVCHLRPVSSCPVSSSVAKLSPAQLQDCSRTTRLQPRTAVWARANGSPRVADADGAHGTSDGPTSSSAHEPATLQFRTAPCWWAEQGWKPLWDYLRRCGANPVPRFKCLDSWKGCLWLVWHVLHASSACLIMQPAMLAMGAGILMDTATVTRRRVAMQSVALGILEHFELGIAGLSVGAKLGGTISRCIKACQGRWLSVSTCSWLPCVRRVIFELDSHEDNLQLQKSWVKSKSW